MLIYNSNKEFLGLDEHDLVSLGYTNLTQLRQESADFADLFVKTPGYIHNFKHVHWIDFIICADSMETPKVIIRANEKNFKCNINVTIAYMTDNPTSKAFLINFQNLRELTKQESASIASDIAEKPTPQAAINDSTPFMAQSIIEETSKSIPTNSAIDEIEDYFEDTTAENDTQNEPITNMQNVVQDPYDVGAIDMPLDVYEPLDVELEESVEEEFIEENVPLREEVSEAIVPVQTPIIKEETNEDTYQSDYVFDPQVASDELGLPIDLIEEFIEDFIAQAKEFKDELYESLTQNDINNVKILSHKLKGVAANLRVEDAHDVLNTINTSSDTNEIRVNLSYLYQIISKLSGEEITIPSENQEEIVEEEEEFVIDFKDVKEPDEQLPPIEPIPQAIVEIKEESSPKIELEINELDLLEETPKEESVPEIKLEIDELELLEETPKEESVPEIKLEIDELDLLEDTPKEESLSEIKLEIDELDLLKDTPKEESVSEIKLEIDELDLLKDTPKEENVSEIKLEIDELELLEDTPKEESVPEIKLEIDEPELSITKELEPTLEIELNEPEISIDLPLKEDAFSVNEIIENTPEVHYDKQRVASEIGIDFESFCELFEDYLNDTNEISQEIESAISTHDEKSWKQGAHKLKSMSENMRVTEFDDALETLLATTEIEAAKKALLHINMVLTNKDFIGEKTKIEPEEIEIVKSETILPKENESKTEEITYNKQSVANEIGIDIESFNELFEDYLNDSIDLCSTVHEAISANNSEEWKLAAVRLKGMSENMRVQDFTQEIELLIETTEQDVANSAINQITSVISKISNIEV